MKRKKRSSKPMIMHAQAEALGVDVPREAESNERFLSPNQAGKILNITGEAVKQWIYHRRLPAVKLANGYWKIRVTDFKQYLKGRFKMAKRRVLLIGTDMPEVTEAVQTSGFDTIPTQNFADALLKAWNYHPALVVIDLSSKKSDPWKFAEKVRASKGLKSIPILLIADNNISDADAERAVELAAQGFIKRPLDVAGLAVEVQRVLGRMN